MRQLVYISTVAGPTADIVPAEILNISRRNNMKAQVSGLLYFDGRRFLQALEGEDAAVAETFARIKDDPRHRAVVILSDRQVSTREFGDWAMAFKSRGQADDQVQMMVSMLSAEASPEVRATFESFAQLRRAA